MAGRWVRAFPLADIPPGGARVFKSEGVDRRDGVQAAIFRTEDGAVHAIDNACPHEGYPLSQGYVKGCILTCAWHNYKFDLRDGRCVQGEEAVRSYPVRIVAGAVEVDVSKPDAKEAVPRLLASLEEGLVDYRMGQVSRDVVRLLEASMPPEELLALAARYDAERAEYGSTHALPVAADALRYLPRYRGADAAYPIVLALDLAAEPSVRRPRRSLPEPVDPGSDPVQAGDKLLALVEDEDTAAAEALVRGALARGWERDEVEPWLYRLCAAHFLDFGHALIYTVKAFDLLDGVGWSHADPILPALVFGIASGTREDDLPAMAPFRRRLDDLEPLLAELYRGVEGPPPAGEERASLLRAVLDGSNAEMFQALLAALERGAPLEGVVDVLSVAAAERLLRFDVAIDASRKVKDGWLFVTHLLTFANAVRHAVERYRHAHVLSFIFQAGAFINRSRPLDLPPARRSSAGSVRVPEQNEEALALIIEAIRDKQPERAVALVHGYLAEKRDVAPLRVTLEDLVLSRGGTRPIVSAHAIKTTFAAFEEHRFLGGDPLRHTPLLALVRFLASPLVERSLSRITLEAIDFVTRGRPPRVLAG